MIRFPHYGGVTSGTADYAGGVTEREACLVDVYDTLLRCDFEGHRAELPALAGLTAGAWAAGVREIGAATGTGRLSTAEGYEHVLRASGAEARPDLVRALVDLDRELLLRHSRLYDDAIPFLQSLRSRGIKIAIVSNCSEHTRDLLESNGVADLADALVLSCEVGAFKPASEIFTHALDQLGVPARSALFVDDQPSYCEGAAALGITAVQIVRDELDGKAPTAGTAVVRSLAEVEAMF
jgi:putative hydrolase of the HAD superfamily